VVGRDHAGVFEARHWLLMAEEEFDRNVLSEELNVPVELESISAVTLWEYEDYMCFGRILELVYDGNDDLEDAVNMFEQEYCEGNGNEASMVVAVTKVIVFVICMVERG
jgi:hypothetical protein